MSTHTVMISPECGVIACRECGIARARRDTPVVIGAPCLLLKFECVRAMA